VIDGYVTPAIIGGSAVAAVVAVAVLALIAQRRGMFVSNKAATDNVPEYGATRTR
jgi:hypothetical protein